MLELGESPEVYSSSSSSNILLCIMLLININCHKYTIIYNYVDTINVIV